MTKKWLVSAVVSVLAVLSVAAVSSPRRNSPVLSDDGAPEIQIGIQRILENINAPGIARGVIIASPSQRDPDYFFHWTRDAGLTIGTLLEQLPRFPQIGVAVSQWASFERGLQTNLTRNGGNLGEPKFEVNGDVFSGPWGRPQNDGPAIRSWAFMRAYGRPDAFIETDLEYLRNHWGEANFDLWEEVKGHHFFTRYSQMAAFYAAARVYASVNPMLSRAYSVEAQKIEDTLSHFIDQNRMLVIPTLAGSQGVQKNAGLDISTVLAPLYFGPGLRWSASQSYVMSTALRLEDAFRRLYPVNSQYTDMAPGIGRYPEDVYDGTGFSQGHAWFLATFGMGEYYCQLVSELAQRGNLRVDSVNLNFLRAAAPKLDISTSMNLDTRSPAFKTVLQGLQDKGRSFIQRAMFHGGADRHYSEQFDRNTGFRRGARDLTWSYAASVRAFQRCANSANLLNQVRLTQ